MTLRTLPLLRSLLPWLLALSLAMAPATPRAASPGDRLVVGLKAFGDGFYELAAKELRGFLKAAPQDPRRPEVLQVLAQAEIELRNWDGARRALAELAGSAGPRGREAPYWLGWVEVQAGRPREAAQHLESYLGSGGGERAADALLLDATLQRQLGDPAAAARRAAQFLERFPTEPRRDAAWQERIGALQEAGEARAAVRAADQALADRSLPVAGRAAAALLGVEAAGQAGDVGARGRFWTSLASLTPDAALRDRARFEAGAALYEESRWDAAGTALNAYLEGAARGAHAPRAHLLLADLARRRGDGQAQLSHLEAALASPQDPQVRARRKELRSAGLSLAVRSGDPARAARHAQALLGEGGLSPAERGLANLVLGDSEAAAGRLDQALARWAAVPEATPSARPARLRSGRALLEQGRAADALERVTSLLEGADPDAEAHTLALEAAEALGDRRRAADLCRALVARPPPGVPPQEFAYRRVLPLDVLGDVGAWRAALRDLAERYPADTRGRWAAALLQREAYRAGDWAEVLRWSPGARQTDDAAVAAYREGEALWRLDRRAEARAAFQVAAEREGPQRGAALARLGTAWDEAGETQAAVRSYRQALQVGLEDDAAGWVRERLEALGAPGDERRD